METRKSFLFIGFAYIALFLGMAAFAGSSFVSAETGPSRKIVVFANNTDTSERAAVMNGHGVKIKSLAEAKSEVALLTKEEEKELAKDPRVLRIEDDIIITALENTPKEPTISAKGKPTPVPPPQTTPWGISKVKADSAWTFTEGSGVRVAIIDTGIDTAHPDLAAHVKGGVNTISSLGSYADDNGHGTHVAGTIGAVQNTIGVVGVAPQADLYAVKALNRRGNGYLSDIIEGIDWSIANNMQVINMSLGSSVGEQSFADAVKRAYDAGIVIVAAAGNSGGSVSYPAAYPEVIAVSATDSSDTLAYFSSFGPEVDIAAPGVSIYSTYKGSSYSTLSGTSMAAPHVAGTAALILSLNGTLQPSEVLSKIQNTARDVGAPGIDSLYGAGIIDAFATVQ